MLPAVMVPSGCVTDQFVDGDPAAKFAIDQVGNDDDVDAMPGGTGGDVEGGPVESRERKKRMTRDFGAPRLRRGRYAEAVSAPDRSPNGSVFRDEASCPKIGYLDMSEFAKTVGILESAGLPLSKYKADLCAYYEQLPHVAREQWLQCLWTHPSGMMIDKRKAFGWVMEPDVSNRLQFSTVFVWDIALRWIAQAVVEVRAAESERVSPQWLIFSGQISRPEEATRARMRASLTELAASAPSAAPQFDWDSPEIDTAAAWSRMRREQGQSGDWHAVEAFFDDTPSYQFRFFHRMVIAVMFWLWRRWNIDVADGSVHPVTQKPRKNKSEEGLDAENDNMTMLGQQLLTGSRSKRHFGEEKRQRYRAAGVALLRQSQDTHQWPNVTGGIRTWISQVQWAGSFGPAVKAYLQELRSALPRGWEDLTVVTASPHTRGVMRHVIWLMGVEDGVALYPRSQPMDNSVRDVWWSWHDSARVEPHEWTPERFVGYSSWLWRHGSREVHYFLDRWSQAELELDISALEFKNMTMATSLFEHIIAASDLCRGRGPSEVWQVCDNRAVTTHVANTGKAKQAALRVLSRERAARLLEVGRRVQAYHVKRSYNRAADEGSKGSHDGLRREVAQTLADDEISFIVMPAPSGVLRSTTEALDAMRRSRTG